MIVKGKPKYDGVLNIPEGKSGEFEIVHQVLPAGTKLQTVTFRTAMHAGHKYREVRYGYPTRWHKLLENGGVWMSDLPIEQFQHDAVFKGFRGRVLVGGLGLGYAITALAAKRLVREIVVVEKSQDVVNLVYEHTKSPKTQVVVADLHEYLKGDIGTFDYGFYDIWQADGEATFHMTVMPLRQASKGKIRKVENWNEDVMRGQLFHGLHSRLMWLQIMANGVADLPTGWSVDNVPSLDDLADASRFGKPIKSVWVTWAQPYWRWFRRTKPSMAKAQEMAAVYAQLYGIGNEYLSLLLGESVTIAGLGEDDPEAQPEVTFGEINEAQA